MPVKGRTQKPLYTEKNHSKYNSSRQELKDVLNLSSLNVSQTALKHSVPTVL